MPLETLSPPYRTVAVATPTRTTGATPTRTAGATPAKLALALPPRLRTKVPVGTVGVSLEPRPRQSAVERLEADKGKYVKSQVALSRPQTAGTAIEPPEDRKLPIKPPLRPPEECKPPLAKPIKPLVKPLVATPIRAARPLGPPEGRRPILVPGPALKPSPALCPGLALKPTRKPLAPPRMRPEAGLLDVQHLSSLISDVTDASAPTAEETGTGGEATPPSTPPADSLAPPPSKPDWSSSARVRLKAESPSSGSAVVGSLAGGAVGGAVRRVDVLPLSGAKTTVCRQFIRPLLHPQPLGPARSYLFPPKTTSGPASLRPMIAPLKLEDTSLSTPGQALLSNSQAPPPDVQAPPLNGQALPLNSQAQPPDGQVPPPNDLAQPPDVLTLRSDAPDLPSNAAPHPPNLAQCPPCAQGFPLHHSSPLQRPPQRASPLLRPPQRPSLTRSLSDVSERLSRVGTDLERFFNTCGLDPADFPLHASSSSDIGSLARIRSASAPGSECCASQREEPEEEEEEDGAKGSGRVPYGVSVIERNARVIKWLYGLRQTKDGGGKNTSS